jgi:hypothetical protein
MTRLFCSRNEGEDTSRAKIMTAITSQAEHIARRVTNKPPGSDSATRPGALNHAEPGGDQDRPLVLHV